MDVQFWFGLRNNWGPKMPTVLNSKCDIVNNSKWHGI